MYIYLDGGGGAGEAVEAHHRNNIEIDPQVSDPIICSMNQVIPVIFNRQISSLGVWSMDRIKKGSSRGTAHVRFIERGQTGPRGGAARRQTCQA